MTKPRTKTEHKGPNKTPGVKRARDTTGDKPSAPNAVQKRDQMQRALDLKRSGLDYRTIATNLGVCAATVHTWIRTILADTPIDGVDEMRQIENERLDRLRAQWVGRANEDIEAAKLLIRLTETSCKINGVFAPVRVEDVTPPREASADTVERLLKLSRE